MVIGEVPTCFKAMMNHEYSTNYEHYIEFTIALMTKDYEKACDIGNRLLKENQNDVDVTRALNILKYKKYEECERSNLIESKRDEADSNNTDFIDDNVDICIDPDITSKIASYDMSHLNNDAKMFHLDFKKMHRVIPIKMNKTFT